MRSLLFLATLCLFSTAQASDFSEKLGRGAPDFAFFTSEGKIRRVSDFRGKWLLLQLGASWCAPSEFTAATFSRIRRALEGRPFEFIEVYSEATLAFRPTFWCRAMLRGALPSGG